MTRTPADIPAPPPLSVSRGAALYIGALLGPGLLLLPGLAAAQAGPASVLAWAALIGLSAMLAAVFTALGRAVPSAGGVAGYTAAGLGRRAGAVAGWCFLAGVVCGAPIVCLIGASYVTELVGGGQLMRAAVAAALLLAVLGLALGGVRATTLAQLVLIALLIVVVVIAVAGSATADRAANWAPFAPHGWLAVGRAASTLMLSFVGWEAVAPLTTRFRDPARQLPRVTGIAFGTTALLYLGLAAATISALGRGAGTDVPLAALLRLAVGPAGRAAAAVAAIVLTLGATNAYLTGAGQMITQLTAGRRAARSSRPFLLLIAAAGLTLIGLYALHIASTAGMVRAPGDHVPLRLSGMHRIRGAHPDRAGPGRGDPRRARRGRDDGLVRVGAGRGRRGGRGRRAGHRPGHPDRRHRPTGPARPPGTPARGPGRPEPPRRPLGRHPAGSPRRAFFFIR